MVVAFCAEQGWSCLLELLVFLLRGFLLPLCGVVFDRSQDGEQ